MLLAVTARQHPLGPSEALFEQHLRDDTERYVNQTEINAQVRRRHVGNGQLSCGTSSHRLSVS